MATTQTKHTNPTVESAFERAGEAGEQLFTVARKAGNLYLDSYEKAVDRAIDVQRRVAGATQQAWLKDMVDAQAGFARELTSSYTSSARTLLK